MGYGNAQRGFPVPLIYGNVLPDPKQLGLFDDCCEDPDYLSAQLITYIGNKRSLLGFIGGALDIVKSRLGRGRLDVLDMFSGSGSVSRFFKASARRLYANDMEPYAETLSRCYLPDAPDVDALRPVHARLVKDIENNLARGFIAEMYAPRDESDIRPSERCFFTPRNAAYIDTARRMIEGLPAEIRHYFLAPLLTEVSVKNNTSGVFKGFYKNSRTGVGQFGGNGRDALSRITRDIALPFPVFSRHSCPVEIYRQDANALAGRLPRMDLAYLDPPYNQHPYGSNYFMLNLVDGYQRPAEVSAVSGIPTDWNSSAYNSPNPAFDALSRLSRDTDARFLLVSFSSEGFIAKDQMLGMLGGLGRAETMERAHNAFRGSRNLRGRGLHVKEYLFLVDRG
jgi:adenine-specific DNA-methyltransferase